MECVPSKPLSGKHPKQNTDIIYKKKDNLERSNH